MVYVLEGSAAGGTAVVVGGTHGNEIAGIMAATLLVERARVTRGRLIVIPHANNSAVSSTDPQRPGPEWIDVTRPPRASASSSTARAAPAAAPGRARPRGVPPPGSTEELDGNEARNLDRAYPGDARRAAHRRIAAAVMRC